MPSSDAHTRIDAALDRLLREPGGIDGIDATMRALARMPVSERINATRSLILRAQHCERYHEDRRCLASV